MILPSQPPRHRFNQTKPSWVNPKKFLPPKLQNLFELGYWTEGNAWLPTGQHGITEDKELPKLSSRIPPEAASSEDQFDDATNGTASNEESSSDDAASRPSTDTAPTRMADESEDDSFATKVSIHRKCRG